MSGAAGAPPGRARPSPSSPRRVGLLGAKVEHRHDVALTLPTGSRTREDRGPWCVRIMLQRKSVPSISRAAILLWIPILESPKTGCPGFFWFVVRDSQQPRLRETHKGCPPHGPCHPVTQTIVSFQAGQRSPTACGSCLLRRPSPAGGDFCSPHSKPRRVSSRSSSSRPAMQARWCERSA